jgi:hypothetical protein
MMTSFFIDLLHYIIAVIILAIFIWIIIYIHNYFSKHNIQINDNFQQINPNKP